MSNIFHARNLKKTKIVATLGPASNDHHVIKGLVEEGVNVARLNFSHGDHEEHLHRLNLVRQVSKELDKPVAILLDVQGPKIRLGILTEEMHLKQGDEVELFYGFEQTDNRLPVTFDFFPYLEAGHHVLINDGLVKLAVDSCDGKNAKCHVVHGGMISTKKGINIPDTFIPNKSFTDKDRADLEFGLEHNVEYVALSFVQTADDVNQVREIIRSKNKATKIISKIERKEAVKNLADIIEASDAVMVARGDLAIEMTQEDVPLIQRQMIKMARAAHKPVIVATQMLESMVVNSEPTRAEVNDVATAVMDLVDAVMLSAETARGEHPIEVVRMMKKIIKRVERHYRENLHEFALTTLEHSQDQTIAVAAASAILSHQLDAEMIVVTTASGITGQRVSSYRPSTPILVLTHNYTAYNQLALHWGVKSFFTETIGDNETAMRDIIKQVQQKGYLHPGEKVVFVTGSMPGQAGKTNTIKVETV